MRNSFLRAAARIACFCISLSALASLHAQSAHTDRNRLEIEGAATLSDVEIWGASFDRYLSDVSVTYERVLLDRRPLTMSFTSTAIPIAMLREPMLRPCLTTLPPQCTLLIGITPTFGFIPDLTRTRSSFGAGASPAGVVVRFLPGRAVQPFAGFRAGFLYFNRNALAPDASQFNFTLGGRFGLTVPLRDGHAISVAYVLQHMSNRDIASDNPGLDASMISFSYSFPLRFGKKQK
jgi:hypothetical protein